MKCRFQGSHSSAWVYRIQRGLLLLSLTSLSACAISQATSPKSDNTAKRPTPIVVATVQQKTAPLSVRTTGTVEAYSTVSVKSQVGGQLTGVYFQQGQAVKKGDLLFKVDARPLQAALRQAEAAKAKTVAQLQQAEATVGKTIAQVSQAKAIVAKNQTQAKNSETQAERYNRLFQEGAISKDQVAQYQTNAASQKSGVLADQESVANAKAAVVAAQADVQDARASIEAADAAIENAAVQLSYSSINAPIDGQAGSLKVTQGNLVKANDDDPLVVINQIRPIYVTFSIPQRLLPDLKKYSADRRLTVEALPAKDPGKPVRGELTFIDNSVNSQTGTLQLKATFQNAEERLAPGQFVDVVLKFREQSNAIVVPTSAVQVGQKGQFVFVVKPDKTVEVRPIKVGNNVGNETVIKEGLQPGEQVVTDGQFNLVPGAAVDIKSDGESQENK